jgi:hypothetical protein
MAMWTSWPEPAICRFGRPTSACESVVARHVQVSATVKPKRPWAELMERLRLFVSCLTVPGQPGETDAGRAPA